MMARGKKGVARPHPTASGLEDSSTATSPSAHLQIEALPPENSIQQATTDSNQHVPTSASDKAASEVPTPTTQSDPSNPVSSSIVKRSFVWEHFKEYDKVVKGKDAEGNDIDIVKKRAHCIHCPRGKIGDFAAESSKNGTSGMIRHINQFCRYYPKNVSKSQRVLVGDKSLGNKLTAVAYDQDDYVDACIEMIVMDELPFSFVEKKGFNRFCARVCPLFKIPSRRKLVRKFLSIYEAQKKELSKIIKDYRVCLTTDTWTSLQNINYMVLTAHFIDVDWKMHKRVINFCVIQNHQGATIGRLIESCLLQWDIEKVLTITVDNASANKSALEWLTSQMNRCSSYKTVLGGKYMHVRCTAHITNLIVGHGLKRLQKSVLAIRNAAKYVRSSPNRLDSFRKAVEKEKLPLTGLVCLDVPTRWNSTYLMLEAALKFKTAFARMKDDGDELYVGYFKEPEEEYDEEGNVVPSKNKRNRVGPPEKPDWDKARIFVDLLRVFYDVTLRVSASLHPTVHTTFHDVVTIERNIENIFIAPLDFSDTENVLTDMAANMRSKFLKYYGGFTDLNHLVIVGLVLDARFKLRNYTHSLKEEGMEDVDVQSRTDDIRSLLMALYDEYVPIVDGGRHMHRHPSPTSSSSTITSRSGNTRGGVRGQLLNSWRKVVQESEEAVMAHEVDQYLNAPLEFVEDEEDGFDILCWWKINGPKFPVMAAIARDVLAIQTSTVASESAFSTGGRVIDAFRSSLTPKTVEALICMQNWLLGDDIAQEEDEPTIENTEFYEQAEKDHESTASSRNTRPTIPKPKGKGKAAMVNLG
ncbi:putative transcription factor/ chromatin remodeling BED-type(Zn) family [Rosa chinensis]|uniref:Putative transcription factor/ chromatin remodeling BED-type(Zn) family n=1 Tax=Rosa chinensis TaxID=74649 RepID=A0A2P6S553_ROSCH|nr:putative transcription factor/ chromatin remodeling BED-type(Zn) family [Rosa chinensis]